MFCFSFLSIPIDRFWGNRSFFSKIQVGICPRQWILFAASKRKRYFCDEINWMLLYHGFTIQQQSRKNFLGFGSSVKLVLLREFKFHFQKFVSFHISHIHFHHFYSNAIVRKKIFFIRNSKNRKLSLKTNSVAFTSNPARATFDISDTITITSLQPHYHSHPFTLHLTLILLHVEENAVLTRQISHFWALFQKF